MNITVRCPRCQTIFADDAHVVTCPGCRATLELVRGTVHPALLATTAIVNRDPGDEVWRGVYPGMCIDPEICKGRACCPRDYSCSE